MHREPSRLDVLCPEVTDIIFSALPTSSLRQLRLVNHHLGSIATKWAFQHVRLGARESRRDHENFIKVAQSETLRPFVRDVTCDTWLGASAENEGDFTFNPPHDFLNALPMLRCFRNLTALHLRFSHRTKHVFTNGKDTETDDFRYRVLDTVFHCLDGSWSVERQQTMDANLLGAGFKPNYPAAQSVVATPGPIPVREITLSNLADFDDRRLTSSDVFKRVLSSTSITDLKLSITQQEVDHTAEHQPESAIWFREKYDMFANLPNTWLCPSIAANLRVLSLYSRDYWGWNPRMDFRAVRPGDGPDSGFPNLKVLALGNYVFSHEWQFDWIASLGQMNASGGLEELYLDKCPIMIQARHQAPADYGTRVIGKDSEGNDVMVSNEGYYRIDGIQEDDTYDFDTTVEDFPLRWHQVLPRWRRKMKALKVLKMGNSSWNFAPKATMEACQLENPSKNTDTEDLKTLLNHNNFRDFDRPSPPSLASMAKRKKPNLDKYRLGAGIDENQKFQLRYVYFDINSVSKEWCDVYWPSSAYPRQPPVKDDDRLKDFTEASHMTTMLENRKRGFDGAQGLEDDDSSVV